MSTSYESSLKWMPQNTLDDKLTSVQAMACCRTWADVDRDLNTLRPRQNGRQFPDDNLK